MILDKGLLDRGKEMGCVKILVNVSWKYLPFHQSSTLLSSFNLIYWTKRKRFVNFVNQSAGVQDIRSVYCHVEWIYIIMLWICSVLCQMKIESIWDHKVVVLLSNMLEKNFRGKGVLKFGLSICWLTHIGIEHWIL